MITLTQALRESEILKLKPSPQYTFKNFDTVSFVKEEKKAYAILEYDNNLSAFILVYYTDSNFSTKILTEDGKITFSFLYHIGLSNLKLV